MFIQIDSNGSYTTSEDQNQPILIFREILLGLYCIVSFMLLAIVASLAIRAHCLKANNTGMVYSMKGRQVLALNNQQFRALTDDI